MASVESLFSLPNRHYPRGINVVIMVVKAGVQQCRAAALRTVIRSRTESNSASRSCSVLSHNVTSQFSRFEKTQSPIQRRLLFLQLFGFALSGRLT
jgi:hypothetical protein